MTAFESISKGLREALGFANADLVGSKVHEVPVAEVHQQSGQSQAAFAKKPSVVQDLLRGA
ncbi:MULTISPECIES: hypothetical protein [Rhodobacterales]|uniref:Uncharacterized protein n=1 Tax=Phaeobacter inhibens TaxID=221822 RepID=A0A2I7KGN4_9RHOB|nr:MULTISPECIES: hypothetical protein [Rhodobacterales]AUR01757.1 hypothetical protein PhaeoP88_04445 [Phaeobacter inhibens]